MKKVLLLMLTIMTLGFFAAPLSAQDESSVLTVADGSSTNGYVPMYGLYLDEAQHNQIIYPESMLGDMVTGEISEMKFHLQNSVSTALTSTITVSLGTTTTETFTSGTLDDVTLTQVYTGAINLSGQEFTITFSTPFTYNGGNLLFDITTTAANWATTTFLGINSNGSSYAYNDVRNFIPKTTFTYTGGALCKTPYGLTSSEITTSTATISWHGDDNASSYNVQYMPSSQTDWANATTVPAYDTVAYLTGLQASSTYKVRVQIECSDNTQTVWSGVHTFITDCDIIPFTDLWFEDFESTYQGSNEQRPLLCWAVPVQDPTTNGPFVYCGYGDACHSGVNSVEMKGYSGAMNMAVLPEFSADIHDLRLTFWATSTNPAYGTLEVGVMTDASDTSTFELVGVCGIPGSRGSSNAGNGNIMGPFDFNTVQAASGRIALRFTSNYSGSYGLSWNLDDFTVSIIPACAEPTNLATGNVTATSAEISWNEVDGTTYDLVYWEVGDEDTIPVTGVILTDNVYTIDNLDPNTTYGWTLRTDCGDGTYANAYQVLTFTTPNVPVDLPYEQDFETDPELITDFTIQGTGNNQWAIGTATFKPEDASDSTETGHSLYISNDNGVSNAYTFNSTSYAYAILDVAFDDTPMEYHLTFDYKLEGEGTSTKWDYLSVYLMDGSAIVPTDAIPSGTTLLYQSNFVSDWTHQDYILENVANSSKKIVFFWKNDSSSGTNPPAAIDNISIVGNACAQPNQLTATGITTDEAILSWNEVGSATSWTVYYKAQNDADYQDVAANNTSVTITGLNADTHYEFYVVADCGAGESNPSNVYNFKTQCGALTSLPYTTSFDDYINIDGSEYVDCWSRLASDPSHMVYHMSSTTYSHASSAGCLDFSYTPACWTTAVMPAFDASIPVNTLMMDFWLDKTGNTGTFEVGVMTDPSDSTTFELVETVTSTISGNSAQYYEHIYVSLASYTGSGQYIAFRVSGGQSCGYRLDDLMVYEIPQCMHPSNLHTTSVGETEVTLAWTEMGDATSWVVAYGLEGVDPDEALTENADQTSITITGLTLGQTYDFYVKAGCESEWEGPISIVTGQYIMASTGSDTLTTCGAAIYDDGGPDGNYSNSSDVVLVLYPAMEGTMMMLTGTSNTENNYDYLKIYDGVGVDGTQLGNYTGSKTVSVISTQGPLTIHFTSDNIVNQSGFELFASCVSCFPPTNLSVSDQDLTGATISWSGIGTEYGVYVILTDTAYYTTTDTFLVLTGLEPSSTYRFMVRSICGADSSDLSQAFNFSTSCGQIDITEAIPWFENFESYTGGVVSLGACWATPETQQVDNGMSPFVYTDWAASAYSGQNTLEMKGGPTMVVLPEFSNDINTLRISMWGNTTAFNAASAGTMVLGYISDVYDATTFVSVDTIPATAFNRTGTDAPHADFIGPYDFSGVTPQTGLRIALRLTDVNTSTTGSSTSWNFDDITVSLIPDCASPVKTSVTSTDIDGHNATITFTDNDPGHDSWTVYYKASDDEDWTPELVSATSVTLSGLDPETTYEVYVVTNCNGVASEDATNHHTFTTTVACPAPTNLEVAATATEAVVTWNGTADSYTVVCGDNTVTATGNTTTLTGLDPATNYMVSVTADCGADGASTPATMSFMTSCVTVVNFPYTEGFENGLGCWQSVESTSSSYNWETTSSSSNIPSAPEGTQFVLAKMSGYTANTVRLLSPVFDLTSVTNPYVSFAHVQKVWGSDQDQMAVYYRASATDEWTMLTEYTNDISAWTVDSLALPSPSSTYQISFVATNAYGYGVGIDQVVIFDNDGSSPVVIEPTVVTNQASAITQTSATLNGAITNLGNQTITARGFEWKATNGGTYTQVSATGTTMTYNLTGLTAGTSYTYRAFATTANMTTYGDEVTFITTAQGQPTEPSATTADATNVTYNAATLNGSVANPDNVTITAQGFEWKAASASTYTTVNATGATMAYNLTGLNATTTYTYRAFVTTANGTHYGQDKTFTTEAEPVEPCDAPTGLTATNVQSESITVTWDNAAVLRWNLQYGPVGGTLASATATTNSYTITNLTPLTTYQIRVQAVCEEGNESEWSSSIEVTTTNLNIYLESNVTLYPNPAKEFVDVRVDGDVNVIGMEVYDVYGKLINTVNVIDNLTRINVSGLANGMYFVRVTTEQGVVTKRFVKK